VLAGVETDVDVVVVALVDGFGYEQFRRDRDRYDLLSRLVERGRVTPLTSIYPSETAAAITTLHTASLPVEHGLLGWDLYVEEEDLLLETLPFRTKDGRDPAAVVGRELDIPTVSGMELPADIEDGTIVTLDAERGVLYKGTLGNVEEEN